MPTLNIPTRSENTVDPPGDINAIVLKIKELYPDAMLDIPTRSIGTGDPAGDINKIVTFLKTLDGTLAPVAPTITSIEPSSAKAGDTVIVTGTGFTGALNVLFAGVAAGSGKFSVLSATQLTVVVPPVAAGSNPVQVVGATATSPARAFLVQAAANAVPVATANQPGTVTQPASQVSLVGTGADTDGTIVAYEWRQVTGPVNAAGIPGTTANVLATGLTALGTYQFGFRVKDDKGAYSPEQFVNVSVVPAGGLSIALSTSATSVPAGTTIVFTAAVTGGTATYVQFKRPGADGANLGIVNTFPAKLPITPQAAGTQKVVAYAIDANGVTYASNEVDVVVTQAQATAPTRPASLLGLWDARVKQLDASGNWLEADGGAPLLATGGKMSLDPTGVKGLPGVVGEVGKGFSLPSVDLKTKNNFSALIVAQFRNPGTTQDQILVATSPYTYGEKGGFMAYVKENFYAGAGDTSVTAGLLFGDYNSYGSIDAREFDVIAPTVLGVDIQPSEALAAMQLNGEDSNKPYTAFQADLFDARGLQVFKDANATVLGIALFNGATAAEKQAYVTYYTNSLGNAVEPNTFFGEDAPVDGALLEPDNNPARIYGTGTKWILGTNTPTATISVVPGVDGCGVWLDGVWLRSIKTVAPVTINLGVAGTKRELMVEMGAIEGSNASENSIQSGGLRSIKTAAGSVSGFVKRNKKRKLCILFGDSIICGGVTGDSALNGAFQRLARLLPDWDFVWDAWGNRAYGGGMTSPAERSVTTTRWQQKAAGYDLVVVYDELGTNDTTNGGTANQVAQWRVALIGAAKAAIPGVKYIVQTPAGRNTEFDNIGGRGTIEDYFQASKAAVNLAYPDVPVYDGRLFLGSADCGDGVHPHPDGAIRMANKIFTAVFQGL